MTEDYYKQYEPIFGAWKIIRLIGEGSFGKVFEIEREDFGVTYKAALKAITVPANESEVREVMAEGMDEASVREYFGTFVQDLVKEFALMSKLKGNSNVVSYENHQVIPHKDRIGWDILIQMELLTPLNEYTRTHTVTRQDVIRLGIDLCKALELCQKYNIIHRDVKPENIFISDAGDFKLGDFGIARTVEKTTSGLSKKGTYTYMAPEVYKGEAYGSTVDLYSLGIVLYRLLNGNRTPFLPAAPAPITHADRENALVKRLSGAALPPPSHGEGRLSEIVLKACAYEAKDRYSSPVQMRHELEAILYSREEGKYIYPEGDDVPQDSVHYVKTGEEALGAGYERTQGDAEKSFGGVSGGEASDFGGTVSDFSGSRTASGFGGTRTGGSSEDGGTVSDFGGNRTASGFGGTWADGSSEDSGTVSDFGGRERRSGGKNHGSAEMAAEDRGAGENPPPEPAARRESNPQPQQKPRPKTGIGKVLAAAGAVCGALAIVLALVLGGGKDEGALPAGRQGDPSGESGTRGEALSGTGENKAEGSQEGGSQEEGSQEEGGFPGDTIYIGVYDIPETGEDSGEPARNVDYYLRGRELLEDYNRENPVAEIDGKEYEIQLVFSSQMEGSYGLDEGAYLLEEDYALDAADFFKENGCAAVITVYDSCTSVLSEMLSADGIPSIGDGGSFELYRGGDDSGVWQFVKEELGAASVLYIQDSAFYNPDSEEFYEELYAGPLEYGLEVESRWYDGGVIGLTTDVIYTSSDVVAEALEAQNYEGPLIMSDCLQLFDSSLDLYYFNTLSDELRTAELTEYTSGGLSALDAYQVIVKALSQCSRPSDLTMAINGTSLEGFRGSFSFDENGRAVYNTVSYWHDGEWKNYKYRATE